MTILTAKFQKNITQDDFTRKFGSFSIAWSLKQSNLTKFEDTFGFIAFQEYQNNRFVLGDPVCSDSHLEHLLKRFEDSFDNICFVQISEKTARILSKQGYRINYFGVESKLRLPYSLNGKEKREIRNLWNVAESHPLVVRELQREEMYDAQIQFRKKKEFNFLIRPYDLDDQSECRIFGTYHNGKIICYSIFDPIFVNEKIIGYAESINRRTSDAVKGARVFTLLTATDIFYKEGIQYINLGLLPFYPKEKKPDRVFTSNRFTDSLFRIFYSTSPFFHNFQGLSFHKSRYNGILIPKYFASKKKIPIAQLLNIYKLTTGSYFHYLTF